VSAVLILSAALTIPPAIAEESPSRTLENQAAASPTEKNNSPPKLEDVRKAYLSAVQNSARRARPKPPDVVPPLAEVYRDLDEVEGISHHERSRKQAVVKARLEQMRDKLIRKLLRDKKLAERRKRRERLGLPKRKPDEEKAEILAGGGANAQAVKLIDLIQNTIAPESWQAAGGNGSISYFDLLKVLVVRQTGEVHHQLGGVLKQLRK